MTSRRTFLRALFTGMAGLVAGAELDMERLLWVPKTMITVPEMATVPAALGGNTSMMTDDWIMREALLALKTRLNTQLFHRSEWAGAA